MSGKRVDFSGGPIPRYVLMAAALGLTLFGLVMIYSASSISASVHEGSSWHYFVRQLIFIGLTVPIAAVLARYDYRALKDRAVLIYGGSVFLLVMTVIVGAVRGGARRWIPLGFFNLQPSELAKIACVMLVAMVAVEWQRGRVPTGDFLRRVGLVAGLPALFIILQPDLGTTLTLLAAVAFVLFLAGIDPRWIGGALLGGVGLVVLAILAEPYRVKRVVAFMDPWADPLGKGYQTVQALMAFGTGGIDGVGLGLSRQKFFYLPAAHTDYILAIIGEEVGLIGTLMVVVGFALIVWSGFKIARGARDPFGALLAGGLTGMLAFQAFLNMAAVTGIMPVTGKPLPFLSYGGSSMLVTMICLGLILSVSQHGAHAPRAVRTMPKTEETARESAHERRGNGRAHLPGADRRRPARRRA